MSIPSMSNCPEVGFKSPIRISIKVLLPEPVEPIIPILSPFLIVKLIIFKYNVFFEINF